MHNLKFMRVALPFLAFVVATGCHSTGGACDTCVDDVSFQFQPAIRASQEVDMIVAGDDANYTGVYGLTTELGPITLSPLGNVDDAGVFRLPGDPTEFWIQSASLNFETPTKITYSVTADGKVVAAGSVTPQYQSFAYCGQVCKKTQVTIPVTQ